MDYNDDDNNDDLLLRPSAAGSSRLRIPLLANENDVEARIGLVLSSTALRQQQQTQVIDDDIFTDDNNINNIVMNNNNNNNNNNVESEFTKLISQVGNGITPWGRRIDDNNEYDDDYYLYDEDNDHTNIVDNNDDDYMDGFGIPSSSTAARRQRRSRTTTTPINRLRLDNDIGTGYDIEQRQQYRSQRIRQRRLLRQRQHQQQQQQYSNINLFDSNIHNADEWVYSDDSTSVLLLSDNEIFDTITDLYQRDVVIIDTTKQIKDSNDSNTSSGILYTNIIITIASTFYILHIGYLVWGSLLLSNSWIDTTITMSILENHQQQQDQDRFLELQHPTSTVLSTTINTISIQNLLQNLDSTNNSNITVVWFIVYILSFVIPCIFIIVCPSWILYDYGTYNQSSNNHSNKNSSSSISNIPILFNKKYLVIETWLFSFIPVTMKSNALSQQQPPRTTTTISIGPIVVQFKVRHLIELLFRFTLIIVYMFVTWIIVLNQLYLHWSFDINTSTTNNNDTTNKFSESITTIGTSTTTTIISTISTYQSGIICYITGIFWALLTIVVLRLPVILMNIDRRTCAITTTSSKTKTSFSTYCCRNTFQFEDYYTCFINIIDTIRHKINLLYTNNNVNTTNDTTEHQLQLYENQQQQQQQQQDDNDNNSIHIIDTNDNENDDTLNTSTCSIPPPHAFQIPWTDPESTTSTTSTTGISDVVPVEKKDSTATDNNSNPVTSTATTGTADINNNDDIKSSRVDILYHDSTGNHNANDNDNDDDSNKNDCSRITTIENDIVESETSKEENTTLDSTGTDIIVIGDDEYEWQEFTLENNNDNGNGIIEHNDNDSINNNNNNTCRNNDNIDTTTNMIVVSVSNTPISRIDNDNNPLSLFENNNNNNNIVNNNSNVSISSPISSVASVSSPISPNRTLVLEQQQQPHQQHEDLQQRVLFYRTTAPHQLLFYQYFIIYQIICISIVALVLAMYLPLYRIHYYGIASDLLDHTTLTIHHLWDIPSLLVPAIPSYVSSFNATLRNNNTTNYNDTKSMYQEHYYKYQEEEEVGQQPLQVQQNDVYRDNFNVQVLWVHSLLFIFIILVPMVSYILAISTWVFRYMVQKSQLTTKQYQYGMIWKCCRNWLYVLHPISSGNLLFAISVCITLYSLESLSTIDAHTSNNYVDNNNMNNKLIWILDNHSKVCQIITAAFDESCLIAHGSTLSGGWFLIVYGGLAELLIILTLQWN